MRTVAAMLCGLLLLGACGPGVDTGTSARDNGSGAAAPAGSVVASHAFTGQTADGRSFDGSRLAGKPAVLWFWAPWCPTCRAQAAGVTRLAQRYAGKVHVVGVGGLGEVDDIRDYAGEVDGVTQLVDPDGEIWRHFGVTAQSTYVVLDVEGNVVARGYLDDHVLAAKVADLAG